MKPNYFDWIIYKLFRWRWNKILRANHGMRQCFRDHFIEHERFVGVPIPNGNTENTIKEGMRE